jgi:hypothetical protein
MSDRSPPSRAEHYREIADSLLRLARQTRHGDVKQELLDLVERFERIAEHADKWEGADR